MYASAVRNWRARKNGAVFAGIRFDVERTFGTVWNESNAGRAFARAIKVRKRLKLREMNLGRLRERASALFPTMERIACWHSSLT